MRPFSNSIVNIFSLYTLQKEMKKFSDFIKKKSWIFFQNYLNRILLRDKFLKIRSSINLPWRHLKSHKKMGLIGSAVLTFMGYKQTDRQTSKVYIDDRGVDFIKGSFWYEWGGCEIFFRFELWLYTSALCS